MFHVFLVLPIAGIDAPHLEEFAPSNGPLLAQHLFLALFNGRGLVVLFFVLSGCVLAMSLQRTSGFGLRNLPGYWIRRGFRLYPLLILAATLGALLQLAIGLEAIDGVSVWTTWHYNTPRDLLLWEWLKNAAAYSNSLNGPAWSIKIELIASVIFPLLYLLALSRPGLVIGTIVLVSWMFLAPGSTENYLRMNLFTFCFFIGAAIPLHGRRVHQDYMRLPKSARKVLLATLVLTFMFARIIINPIDPRPPSVIFVETVCAAGLVTIVLFSPGRRVFDAPVLQWLGRISYGVYLLHHIVMFALIHFALRLLPIGDTSQALYATALLAVATLAITLPAAWLIYSVLERPLQLLGSASARAIDTYLTRDKPPVGAARPDVR
jgi:peptidoglycan/LPS O-acetylase OafA/YrhL